MQNIKFEKDLIEVIKKHTGIKDHVIFEELDITAGMNIVLQVNLKLLLPGEEMNEDGKN